MATKTETTSWAANPSFAAPHNPFANFDPVASWQQALAEATDRARAWAGECAAIETQMYARARAALDSWHQLALDAITYSEQLSAQTRKAMFETMRTYGAQARGDGAGARAGTAGSGGASAGAAGSGGAGAGGAGSGA